MERDENTIALAEIIMSDYLIDASILYGDVYYHKDECVYCEDCGCLTPEDLIDDEVCPDCIDADTYRDGVSYDYNNAIEV